MPVRWMHADLPAHHRSRFPDTVSSVRLVRPNLAPFESEREAQRVATLMLARRFPRRWAKDRDTHCPAVSQAIAWPAEMQTKAPCGTGAPGSQAT